MSAHTQLASGHPQAVANIQALRAFAAMAVVWHHLETRINSEMDGPHMGFTGMSGVDVFFVISGFIMFHTTNGSGKTAAQFWLDRFIRIAPLYWLATGLVVALCLLGLHPNATKALDGGDVVAALAFFPDVRADGVPYTVLDVGWTLVFEAWFYLLFGLAFALRSQGKALAALSVLFGALALVRGFAPGLPFALEYWFRPITLEFAAGGALALLWRSRAVAGLSQRVLRVGGWVLLSVGLVALLIGGWRLGWRLNHDFELRLIVFGAPAVMIVAGALALEKVGVTVRSPFVLLLGAASYSIYLCHQFVVEGIEKLAGVIVHQVTLPIDLGMILVGLVTAAALGIGIHRHIELPLTRSLKRFVHRPRLISKMAPRA
jgi:exopolysaccharide production protein ExoZ